MYSLSGSVVLEQAPKWKILSISLYLGEPDLSSFKNLFLSIQSIKRMFSKLLNFFSKRSSSSTTKMSFKFLSLRALSRLLPINPAPPVIIIII